MAGRLSSRADRTLSASQRTESPSLSSRSSGSSALAFIFTSFVALSVTLTFVNLVRYVGATNAVEQAARNTTRCLTPTDPDCVQYASSPANVTLDWWGYNNQSGNSAQDIFLDNYDYDATMFRQGWQQNFTTYDVHKVVPTLNYTSYDVQQRTFQRTLNPWEAHYAHLNGCAHEANVFRPKNAALFPHFDYDFETNTDSNDSWNDYCYAQDTSGGTRCCANPDGSNCSFSQGDMHSGDMAAAVTSNQNPNVVMNSSNASEWFNSGWISAPVIPGASSTSTCTDQYGRNCSTLIAGSSAGNGHWWATAQVAFKIKSHVSNNSAQSPARVTWSQILVEGKRPDGTVYNIPAKVPHNGGYGGRAAQSFYGGQNIFYHLWLRGPKNSHGGGSAGDYEDIRVARGDQFRVRARMERELGSFTVTDVDFYIYMDEYEEAGASNCHDCPLTLNPGGGYRQSPPYATIQPGIDGPATPQQCGFPAGWVWDSQYSLTLATPDYHTVVPSCTGNPVDFFPAPPPGLITEQAAVCSANWQPTNNTPPANRSFCGGWQTQTQSPYPTVNVATVPSNCPLAQAHNDAPTVCDHDYTFDVTGNYGNKNLCSPGVGALINAKNSATNAVNSSQPPGAPIFNTIDTNNLAWGTPQEYSPPKWEFSWQSAGGSNICNCSQIGQPNCSPVTCRDNHQVANTGDIYRHKPGSNWSIGAANFPAFNTVSGSNGQNPPQGNPDNLTYAMVSETPLHPTGEPFDAPTPAVHWGNPADTGQFDYDADCNPDDECPDAHQHYGSEEEWLRAKAATTLSAASDSDLVFNYTAQWLGTEQLSPTQYANATLPNCTKARSICTHEPDGSSLAYLGRFSNSEYPNGPAACHDGTWDGCSSQVVGGSITEGGATQTVNYAAARSRGCEELRRFDPSVPQGVCDNIAIDTTSGPMANVQVSYNMPLTPPFDLFVGSDHLTVTSENSEVMEMKMVGRQ